MSIDLTGAGTLTADAALAIAMLCAMTGAGDLAAALEGRLNMSIDMEGAGDLAAGLSALGNMAIALSGSGDLDATIAAYGNMTIDIVVTGTGLSTANVGQAVWSALAASNNDAGTMGEKLNDAGSAANPWTEDLSGTQTPGTAGFMLKVVQQILRNKTKTDPATGIMTVYDDDNTTVLFTANLSQDAAETTPYSGNGAEVRGKLE